MTIKLICLNVWQGGKLFDNIQAFIAREQADILALQEVYHAETDPPDQAWHRVGELARILGYQYFAFAPSRSEILETGTRAQVGNAVFSKYPIQSSRTVFFDIPYDGQYAVPTDDFRSVPRNIQRADITIDDRILYVFNTQGIWGFDGDDNPRRLHMGDVIAQEIADKHPALLTGDFNVQERTATPAKIERHMHNVFGGELTTSFNLTHKDNPGFATAIVDMMFTSPDIQTTHHEVAADDVSDHLTLVGEFEIP